MKLLFDGILIGFWPGSHNARKPHVQCRFFLPAGEHFFLSCAVSYHINLAGLFFFFVRSAMVTFKNGQKQN